MREHPTVSFGESARQRGLGGRRALTGRPYDTEMAFYLPVAEDRFESTGYTRGPWSAATQAAGPPAALLGRAIEARAGEHLRVARLTFDIARPVPIAALTVTTSVVRQGRSVTIIEAAVEPYLRCTALLIRVAEKVSPDVDAAAPQRLADADTDAKPFFPLPYDLQYDRGYHTAMRVRFSTGAFTEQGSATAWMRMDVPLVEGETPSPLTRVLTAADAGSGISNVLDFRRYTFVNPDLTVHLSRYPVGEWVCLRAATSVDGAGIGLADTALYDEQGRIGRCAQSLLISER